MNKITHFNLPENTNKLYANETRSSISLTVEVANSANTLGLNDIDYVNAMMEVCKNKGVKCFDNYHESGVTFADWFDEGVAQGTTANKHISKEGYKWLLPIYENLLRGVIKCRIQSRRYVC